MSLLAGAVVVSAGQVFFDFFPDSAANLFTDGGVGVHGGV